MNLRLKHLITLLDFTMLIIPFAIALYFGIIGIPGTHILIFLFAGTVNILLDLFVLSYNKRRNN